MNLEYFTENKRILSIIEDLNDYKERNGLVVSDIIDDKGFQYVDLVQEGGGMLGIALMGYTYVMEQMGIRFLSLAGTSAGAINTVLMAAADKPGEVRSTKIIELLAKTDLGQFIDGDDDVKDFIDVFNQKENEYNDLIRPFYLALKGGQVVDNLKEDMGLNPGTVFQEWLEKSLAGFNVTNINQLESKMNSFVPSIRIRNGAHKNSRFIQAKLAIIAADLTTETKVEFPDMGHLYFRDPRSVNPAYYVRASMSIPVFFHPIILSDLPDDKETKIEWEKDPRSRYKGPHPDEVIFVDGGVMSNFPIDVFHKHDSIPNRPTFGVKIGLDRDHKNDIHTFTNLLFSTFNAARQMRDTDFILKNPDYEKLVCNIDFGNHHWLDFNMSFEDKLDLFYRGAKTAANFLKNFKWDEYKSIRKRRLRDIADMIMGRPTDYYESTLDRAAKVRKLEISTNEYNSLIKRLRSMENYDMDYNLLWVDDKDGNDLKEKEILRSIGVKIDLAMNSAEALTKMKAKEYDLLISDIRREGNDKEGLDFHKKLIELKNTIPLIFYISDFDKERGTPPQAFGITNSPYDLIHLVIDILQRCTPKKKTV